MVGTKSNIALLSVHLLDSVAVEQACMIVDYSDIKHCAMDREMFVV